MDFRRKKDKPQLGQQISGQNKENRLSAFAFFDHIGQLHFFASVPVSARSQSTMTRWGKLSDAAELGQ